ncbi:hypothetical protein Ccrd_011755 [Cynara cardunculus var. scolymus]|uniref:Uncharacterized protein n=1 Tax=Cynara cardunculus var. scolymus TaxID=59895 RepID=A0A103YIP6_CYNCS|nr:hypothetical protein Ccrd_011755 [Cynara cardunculus var. scolymus]
MWVSLRIRGLATIEAVKGHRRWKLWSLTGYHRSSDNQRRGRRWWRLPETEAVEAVESHNRRYHGTIPVFQQCFRADSGGIGEGDG